MIVFHGKRFEFYPYLPKQVDVMVEFGVFKGENAAYLSENCRPKELMLVDAWQAITHQDFPHLSVEDFEKIRKYSHHYYGGDVCQQDTHDRIYDLCMSRVNSMTISTSIFRMKVKDFYQQCADLNIEKLFDIAYIDASHQYEDVLWELLHIQKLLKPNALIILNDVYWGKQAFEQNMGVLQAVNASIQITNYRPLLLTDSLFSDLVLTNTAIEQGSLAMTFLQNIENATNPMIEVPDEALFSFNHNIPSFWKKRILPSFKIHS
jgi:hypothetical protein